MARVKLSPETLAESWKSVQLSDAQGRYTFGTLLMRFRTEYGDTMNDKTLAEKIGLALRGKAYGKAWISVKVGAMIKYPVKPGEAKQWQLFLDHFNGHQKNSEKGKAGRATKADALSAVKRFAKLAVTRGATHAEVIAVVDVALDDLTDRDLQSSSSKAIAA